MLCVLVALGFVGGLGWPYGAAWVLIAALLTYEHALVRPDDLARVNRAFFHVNVVVSMTLMVAIALDVFAF